MYYIEDYEVEKIIESEGLTVYKSGLCIKPHVLYKNLYKYTKNFISAGIIVDGDCFEDAAVTLKQRGQALAEQKTNCFGDFKFDGLDNDEYTVEVDAGGKKWSSVVVIENESKNLGYIML